MEPIYRILKFIWHIFWYADTRASRCWIAAGSVLWGIMLAWPGDSFQRSVYHLMEQMASETTWAVAFGLHGLAEAFRIGCNGQCFKNQKVAVAVDMSIAIWGCCVWTLATACMIVTHPLPSAIAPHIVMSFGAWWLLVRCGDYPSFHRRVTDVVL